MKYYPFNDRLYIFVVGHKRHGKDTFCEQFSKHTGYSFGSSSFEVAEMIYPFIKDKYGYTSVQECFDGRVDQKLRDVWFNFIKAYNLEDETKLAQRIFQKHEVYAGIRRIEELQAFKKMFPKTLVIWVDASERCELEPESSMTIPKSMATVIIPNNGTEEDFKERIRIFSSLIKN